MEKDVEVVLLKSFFILRITIIKTVYIMSGASGSGKTTLANKMKDNLIAKGQEAVICSADKYFMKDGEYKFDVNKLKYAHEYCKICFDCFIECKVQNIFVDNTNTTKKECKYYVEQAVKHGYKVEIVRPNNEWSYNAEELSRKNVHGVPKENIQKMLDRLDLEMTPESILLS